MRRNPSPRSALSALALALGAQGCMHTLYAQTHAGAHATAAAPPRAQAPARFNTSLLVFPVDVRMFADGNPVPPGDYRVDVYLNNAWKGKHHIRFETLAPGERIAQPCFTAALLDALGFDPLHIDAVGLQVGIKKLAEHVA